MFRRFDRLVPLLSRYEWRFNIPIKDRWECRDFKIRKPKLKLINKDSNINGYANINGYTYGIPFNEQWECKDFILKKRQDFILKNELSHKI